MATLEGIKKKFAGKNFIVFSHTVKAAVKNEDDKIYDELSALNCDTAIDLEVFIKQVTGEGGKIVYYELPGASVSPRMGSLAKTIRSFEPREPLPAEPAETKTADKVEEVKKRLGRPAKIAEVQNEQ